ncbi:hypothetical protein OC846_005574, partial [Tilletia horrida]
MAPDRAQRAPLALKATYPTMAAFKGAVTDYGVAHNVSHKWEASKSNWAIAVCHQNKDCDFR